MGCRYLLRSLRMRFYLLVQSFQWHNSGMPWRTFVPRRRAQAYTFLLHKACKLLSRFHRHTFLPYSPDICCCR